MVIIVLEGKAALDDATSDSSVTASSLPDAEAIDTNYDTRHLKQNLKRRTIRAGAITLIGQAGKFVLQLGSTAALARLLTPADFGLVAMVTVITGFVGLFKDGGLSLATVQREKITHAQVSTLFWINVGLSSVIMVVIVGLAPIISRFYGDPRLTLVTIILATSMIFGGIAVQPQAILRRQMMFGRLAAIDIVSMIVGVGTAILMAWFNWSYWSLVGMSMTTSFVTAVMSICMSGLYPARPKRGTGVRQMIAFGGGITGFTTLNYFARNSDNFLIGIWWGPTILGFYSRAYALLLLPIGQIIRPLVGVIQPALSRLADDPKFRSAFLRSLRTVTWLTAPVIGILAGGAPLVINTILGPKWGGVVPMFRPLSIASLFQPLLIMCGVIFTSRGMGKAYFQQALISSVPIVIAFVIGVPFGPAAVGWAYALTVVFIVIPLVIRHVSRHGHVKQSDLYRSAAETILISALFALPAWLISARYS